MTQSQKVQRHPVLRLKMMLTACYLAVFIPPAFCGSEQDSSGLIRTSVKVDAYKVARALPPSPALITQAAKTFGDTLSGEKLRKFKLTVLSAMRRPDSGMRAACPFAPDFAFRLNGRSPHWWLVSKSCLGAKLVGEGQDWRRVELVPMTESDIQTFTGLAGGQIGGSK